MIKSVFRTIRRTARRWQGREPRISRETKLSWSELGGTGANWRVHLPKLSPQSVVYSFGVGTDVSFDLALIQQTGATVHAFDPTPRSLAWVATQSLPREFRFHQLGLYGSDGEVAFAPPHDQKHVSYSVANKHGPGGIRLRVNRLETLMNQLGHRQIDLLKMDIEGSEYSVLEDFERSRYKVDQLLIEFHHWMKPYSVADTELALRRLNKLGYRLFAYSDSGHECSFILESPR